MAIITRDKTTGQFRKVTPASVFVPIQQQRKQATEQARRNAARRNGYRGPLTRDDLASR